MALYRGTAWDTAAGWRSGSLPVSAAIDDQVPPFPMAAAPGGDVQAQSQWATPLTLFRLLSDGANDAGSVLRATKWWWGARLTF